MQEVALYDRNRKPASWMEIIQSTQYAVFLRDIESGAPLKCDGRYMDAETGSCLIFDSLEEAEQYCHRKIEGLPNLQCDVFDRHGRVNPPVATFVGERFEGRLDSPARAKRMMLLALLSIAASFPLFWYTWKTRGEGWLAAFFGAQLVIAGLRLLQWGYGMKEEFRYRKAQLELRKQRNDAGGSKG